MSTSPIRKTGLTPLAKKATEVPINQPTASEPKPETKQLPKGLPINRTRQAAAPKPETKPLAKGLPINTRQAAAAVPPTFTPPDAEAAVYLTFDAQGSHAVKGRVAIVIQNNGTYHVGYSKLSALKNTLKLRNELRNDPDKLKKFNDAAEKKEKPGTDYYVVNADSLMFYPEAMVLVDEASDEFLKTKTGDSPNTHFQKYLAKRATDMYMRNTVVSEEARKAKGKDKPADDTVNGTQRAAKAEADVDVDQVTFNANARYLMNYKNGDNQSVSDQFAALLGDPVELTSMTIAQSGIINARTIAMNYIDDNTTKEGADLQDANELFGQYISGSETYYSINNIAALIKTGESMKNHPDGFSGIQLYVNVDHYMKRKTLNKDAKTYEYKLYSGISIGKVAHDVDPPKVQKAVMKPWSIKEFLGTMYKAVVDVIVKTYIADKFKDPAKPATPKDISDAKAALEKALSKINVGNVKYTWGVSTAANGVATPVTGNFPANYDLYTMTGMVKTKTLRRTGSGTDPIAGKIIIDLLLQHLGVGYTIGDIQPAGVQGTLTLEASDDIIRNFKPKKLAGAGRAAAGARFDPTADIKVMRKAIKARREGSDASSSAGSARTAASDASSVNDDARSDAGSGADDDDARSDASSDYEQSEPDV